MMSTTLLDHQIHHCTSAFESIVLLTINAEEFRRKHIVIYYYTHIVSYKMKKEKLFISGKVNRF